MCMQLGEPYPLGVTRVNCVSRKAAIHFPAVSDGLPLANRAVRLADECWAPHPVLGGLSVKAFPLLRATLHHSIQVVLRNVFAIPSVEKKGRKGMNSPENFAYLVAAAKELEKQRSIYFLENQSLVLQERQRSPFLRPGSEPKLSSVTHQKEQREKVGTTQVKLHGATIEGLRQEPSASEIRQLVTGLWGNTTKSAPHPAVRAAAARAVPYDFPVDVEVSVESLHVSDERVGQSPPPPLALPLAVATASRSSSSLSLAHQQPQLSSARRIQTPLTGGPVQSGPVVPSSRSYSDIPLTPPSLIAASTKPDQPGALALRAGQPTIVGWSTARDVDQLRRRIHVPTTPSQNSTETKETAAPQRGPVLATALPSTALVGSSFVSYNAKLILIGKEAQESREAITQAERQCFAEILSEARVSFERVARSQLELRIRAALIRLGREEQPRRLAVLDEEASAREEVLQFASVAFGRTLVLSKERASQRASATARLCGEDEFVARRTIELDETTNRAAIAHSASTASSRWKIERALADARNRLRTETAALLMQETEERRDVAVSEDQLRDTFTVIFRGMHARMQLLHQQEYHRRLRLAEMTDNARTSRAAREQLFQNEARSRAVLEHMWAEEASDRLAARGLELSNLHRSIATARHRDAMWQQQQNVQLTEQEERDVLEQQEDAARRESLDWWKQLFERARMDVVAARLRMQTSLKGQESSMRMHIESLREEFVRHLASMFNRQLHSLQQTAVLARELCEEEQFERGIVMAMQQRGFSTIDDFKDEEYRMLHIDMRRVAQAKDHQRKVARLQAFEADEREALGVEYVTVFADIVKRCHKAVSELLSNMHDDQQQQVNTLPRALATTVHQPPIATSSVPDIKTRRIASSSSPPRDLRAATISLVREEDVNREIISGVEFRERVHVAHRARAEAVAALVGLEASQRKEIIAERGHLADFAHTLRMMLHLEASEDRHRQSLLEGYSHQLEGLAVHWRSLRTKIEQAAEVRAQLVHEIQRRQVETIANEASVRRVVQIDESQRRSVLQSAISVAITLARFFATEAHDRATISDFFEYERWNMTDLEMVERQQLLDSELSPLGSDTEDELFFEDEQRALSVPAIINDRQGEASDDGSSIDDPFGDEREQGAVSVHHAFAVTRAAPPAATVHSTLETGNLHNAGDDSIVSRGGLVVHSSSFMTQYPPAAALPLARPPWRSITVEPPPKKPDGAHRRGGQTTAAALPAPLIDIAVREEELRSELELLESRMVVELLQYDAESILALD